MITKIFAVCLLVENLESSVQFYRDKLGLVVNSQDTGFVDFKLGETPLALFQKSEATSMFPSKFMSPAGGVVLALQVDDVEKTCNELEARGVLIFEKPKKTSWGQTVAYLHDPDGYIIELTN
jgi:catechol 2,3-dioxygenase-like lactoylglutathione lyase family enzyme